MSVTSRRTFAFALLVIAAGCEAPPPPSAEQMAWGFEDAALGGLPTGFVVEATHRQGPLAKWEVVAVESAASAPNVLSKCDPKGAGYDSYNLCWTSSMPFQDGVLAVKLCARSGVEDQGGGLMWRAQGPDDYYVARLNPLEQNLRLYHVVGGNCMMLASAPCGSRAGRWHELRVEHHGTVIRCSVDGAQKIEIVDATLATAGGIGLWTKADAATDFDDLRVERAVR